MTYGHDPRDVREYPWRDIEVFLATHGIIELRQSFGGIPDG